MLILRNRVFRRSADIQEFCFQAAKLSDMDCVEVQVCLFADCQERHFQAANRSDKSSTILQVGRFADVQEQLLQGAKRSEMCSSSRKRVGCSGIAYLVCEMFRYGHCLHERTSIC